MDWWDIDVQQHQKIPRFLFCNIIPTLMEPATKPDKVIKYPVCMSTTNNKWWPRPTKKKTCSRSNSLLLNLKWGKVIAEKQALASASFQTRYEIWNWKVCWLLKNIDAIDADPSQGSMQNLLISAKHRLHWSFMHSKTDVVQSECNANARIRKWMGCLVAETHLCFDSK